ncbi:hypothetical protein EOPP23_05775 [Endozoicomonas sp. OPT23]|uniref:hypothetical protein n=1 Tax=Endozoicomonas sp. OPT23 TaxID=2072845 RepID=UPI00129AF29F|nr:hypothetical protein [Endozoicomonas sp. OPT23]MRI32494.1 hypothetical protein [Endozoicomonas sp. OPT23]
MNRKALFILLGVSVFSPFASAIDCYEESRSYLSQGDDYFDLKHPATFSRTEKKAVKSLYESINGEWEGTAVFTDCRGAQRALREKNVEFTVKAEIGKGSREIIRFRLSKKSDGTSRREIIDIFNSDTMFDFKQRGSTYRTEEKLYLAMGKNRVSLIENIISLEKSNDEISLNITSYINGAFSHKQEISLAKI